jgi:alpha-1,3-mannosyl-glycoprotein beta-1,2-N-acetylglucosaminyltransferase
MTVMRTGRYDSGFLARVHGAPEVTVEAVMDPDTPVPYPEVRVMYRALNTTIDSFEMLARKLGVMDNIKARVPRTAYKGVVTFWYQGTKVHLVPTKQFY